jgi:hypothetical protein
MPDNIFDVPRFGRFGRTFQLKIESASDLKHAEKLDEALWVATAAPILSLTDCDQVLLQILDTDADGRIIADDVQAAIKWLFETFKNTDRVTQKSSILSLADINTENTDGKRLVDAAKTALHRLGKADSSEIDLGQVRGTLESKKQLPVGENGVILPTATEDPALKEFIQAIIKTLVGADHPSGAKGVDAPSVDKFVELAKAWLDWQAKGQLPEDGTVTPIMPLGHATPDAFAKVQAIRAKLDQYYAQCRLLLFDPATKDKFTTHFSKLEGPDLADPVKIAALLEAAPLSAAHPDLTLNLDEKINPAFTARVKALESVAEAILGGQDLHTLSFDQWSTILEKLKPYEAWVTSKPGAQVEPLGVDKLTQYLDPALATKAKELIATSKDVAESNNNLRLVEKAILFQSLMIRFVNNFISMPELFDIKTAAMFEMGTLVMDGRRFNLCIKVHNRAEHASFAGTGGTFIMYVECVLKNNLEKMELAVPVTAGLKGNVSVGKRGIYIDRQNREWNARAVQIIENPISFEEAIVSPFIRLGAMITGKIESLAGNAQKSFDESANKAISAIESGKPPIAAPPAAAPAAAPAGSQLPGLLVGGGLAFAAVSSAFAYIISTLVNLHLYKVIIGLTIALMMIFAPILLLAWIRLRKRDLSAILEGSTWAINARLRMTHRLSLELTETPPYPKNASGTPGQYFKYLVGVLIFLIILGIGSIAYFDYQAQAEKERQALMAAKIEALRVEKEKTDQKKKDDEKADQKKKDDEKSATTQPAGTQPAPTPAPAPAPAPKAP